MVDNKIPQGSVKVTLGGQEYEIKPLVIKESKVWRKKVIKLLSSFSKYAEVTLENPKDFSEALATALMTMPDQMADLFFEYAKELNREEIEEVAFDYEVIEAFGKVSELAFPFSADTFGGPKVK